PEKLYLSRRELMAGALALAAVGGDAGREAVAAAPPAGAPLKATPNPAYRVQDAPTKFEAASTYNNFYEFGVNKDDPSRLGRTLNWPYTEGLRLDEAMHPLTLLTVGMYGQVLPNPNGAPVRVVIPWKYGFKSAKSIVRIRLTDTEPKTAWNKAAPQEYGFYSNVNPKVDHPRWSQGTERRIGEFRRRTTLMFNGYADQVASLYTGMDLKKNY